MMGESGGGCSPDSAPLTCSVRPTTVYWGNGTTGRREGVPQRAYRGLESFFSTILLPRCTNSAPIVITLHCKDFCTRDTKKTTGWFVRVADDK